MLPQVQVNWTRRFHLRAGVLLIMIPGGLRPPDPRKSRPPASPVQGPWGTRPPVARRPETWGTRPLVGSSGMSLKAWPTKFAPNDPTGGLVPQGPRPLATGGLVPRVLESGRPEADFSGGLGGGSPPANVISKPLAPSGGFTNHVPEPQHIFVRTCSSTIHTCAHPR